MTPRMKAFLQRQRQSRPSPIALQAAQAAMLRPRHNTGVRPVHGLAVLLNAAEPEPGKPVVKAQKKEESTFWRLVGFCGEDWPKIILGMIALCTNGATNLMFPKIMGSAVDRAAAKGPEAFKKFLLGAFGMFVVGGIASFVRVFTLGLATDSISRRMRRQLFGVLLTRSQAEFDKQSIGELMTTLQDDVDAAASTFTQRLSSGIRALNSAINGTAMLLMTSAKLTLVSVSIVPVIGVGTMLLSKYSKKLANKRRDLVSRGKQFTLERLEHLSTVRLNCQEEAENDRYAALLDETHSISKSANIAESIYMAAVSLAGNTSLIAVLFVGGGMLNRGEITAGGLTAFAIQSAFVGLGFAGLATFYNDMSKGLLAASNVFKMLDAGNAQKDHAADGQKLLTPATVVGHIQFENVSFQYPSRPDAAVLEQVNLEFKPKHLYAIVGPSGVGKSTLVSLLTRLYDPTAGAITLDGQNIADLDTHWLRTKIAVVEQTCYLFADTIANNIRYGLPNATDEEVMKAARDANADSYISSLPDGYSTYVGEGGSLLSGGQAQRIAIARALLRKPSVLILDEATSALDGANERVITDTVLALREKCTVVVIAHSATVMKHCDHMFVLDQGKISDQGSYEDLIHRSASVNKIVKAFSNSKHSQF